MCSSDLVSNVVSLSRMIFNRRPRDWHTDAAHKDQLPLPRDLTQETQTSQPSFSGKRKARTPRIAVTSTQGTATYSLCAPNQDARHKAEHDPVGVAAPTIWKRVQRTRVPGAGRDPVSAHRALHLRTLPRCHSGRRRAAPQTRNPGATRTTVRTCTPGFPLSRERSPFACLKSA